MINFARLEYDDGDRHRKFWQTETVELAGTYVVTTMWGRLDGRNPQSQTKYFTTRETAEKHVHRMVAEKRRKGYLDAGVFV